MRIEDEKCLDSFRQAPCCEYCHAPSRDGLHPHHWYARGMGGASRLDIRENLISLCPACHGKVHDGNIHREAILVLIALREKKTPEEIKGIVYRLLADPSREMP